jgi:hypothetical protein
MKIQKALHYVVSTGEVPLEALLGPLLLPEVRKGALQRNCQEAPPITFQSAWAFEIYCHN